MLQRALGSLRGRIVTGGLAIILAIGVVWLATGTYFLNRYQHCFEVERLAERVHIQALQAQRAEKDFLLYDIHQTAFHTSGTSANLKLHQQVVGNLQQTVHQLDALLDDSQSQTVGTLGQGLEEYNRAFKNMLTAYRQEGFQDRGLEGRWRLASEDVERRILNSNNLPLAKRFLQLRGNERELLLGSTDQYLPRVRADISNLRTLAAQTPQGGPLLNAVNAYERNLDEFVKLQERIGTTENSGLQGELRASVERIEPLLDTLAEQAYSQSREARRELMISNLLVLLGGITLGSIIFSLLAKSLTAPLVALKDTALQIGAGQLEARVPVRSGDEIGVLGQTFNNMAENLQRINQQVRSATNTLAASATQILASTTQVAASASETAAAVTETTATVEEVRQTAHLSNQKARDVSENAQRSAQISLSGTHSVGETIAGMERVREQMTHIAESVINLSEQSQAIGDIINTVNDLAEQSNLLAVNAAIEAAKAGEQGKGFAVVAQEVKTLAQQSKQATTQVRTLLNEIQKATGAAVMATEQGTKAVEAGLSQAEDAGQSIDGLSRSIDNAAQAAMQIAASSQEQLIGVDQVALAMSSIKDASAQNATSMRQLETAARDLHEVGQSLQQIIGKVSPGELNGGLKSGHH